MTGRAVGCDRVDEVLRQMAPIVSRPRPGLWQVKAPGLARGSVNGQIRNGWLTLTARVPGRSRDPWGLLTCNRSLAPAAKYALDPGTGRPVLRADVSLDRETPLTLRVREAWAGLWEAVAAERGGSALDGTGAGDVADGMDVVEGMGDVRDVSRWLTEAGWSVTERKDGLAVVLGSSAAGISATVSCGVDGRLTARAPMVDLRADDTREAVAVWLLRSTAVVRGVRATAGTVGERAAMSVETGFASAPSELEVEGAIAALSVACQRSVPEAHALRDPRLAETYLARWAPAAHPRRVIHTKERKR